MTAFVAVHQMRRDREINNDIVSLPSITRMWMKTASICQLSCALFGSSTVILIHKVQTIHTENPRTK